MTNNVEEKSLRTGDILLCSTNRLIGRMIKKVTKSNYSHTAQVIEAFGEVLIIEAQSVGVNVISYSNWIKKYNYEYLTIRPDNTIIGVRSKYCKKALSKTGRFNYDYKAILLEFPHYIWTGRWKGGQSEEEALRENRYNCSTFTAFLAGFKEWWKFSPETVYQECKKSLSFTFL